MNVVIVLTGENVIHYGELQVLFGCLVVVIFVVVFSSGDNDQVLIIII